MINFSCFPAAKLEHLGNRKWQIREIYFHFHRTTIGKAISEARGEMRRAIEEVDSDCAVVPSLTHGYMARDVSMGIDPAAINEPVGVF